MIVESRDLLHLGFPAQLVTEDRELAWAERFVRRDPDLAWVLGNYVEAENANSNGHIFPLEDLKAAQATLTYKPLNVLHQGRYVVGAFVGSELIPAEEELAEAASAGPYPVMEALAAMWKNNFPDEVRLIERAHAEGSLYFSMETIPEEIECAEEGCGKRTKYQGRKHDSYCRHLNEVAGSQRKLYKPHFNAGALIFPPIKPGWKRAEINELSQLMKEHFDEAEQVYASLETELPHLTPVQWETMMNVVMRMAKLGR